MDFLVKNGNKEEYWKRIKDVAQKLHEKADDLRKKGETSLTLTWETFSFDDYMKAGQPSSPLEEKYWKEKRANMWKDDVNKEFCDRGFSEWLFVEPAKGIRLEIDRIADMKLVLQSIKKICSTSDGRSELLMQASERCTGKRKKRLQQVAHLLGPETLLPFIAGSIQLEPSQTISQKNELLNMIGEYSSDEDEEN